MGLETSLLERCLTRARDLSDKQCTRDGVINICERDIWFEGTQAQTQLKLRGTRGRRQKEHRRLFPSGPLGVILWESEGMLTLEFPSVELLCSLAGPSKARSALASHFTERAEPKYPLQMTVGMAMEFAHRNLAVEIDPDLIEALFNSARSPGLRSGPLLIADLLEVESHVIKQRWKRVDLARWRTTGQISPWALADHSEGPRRAKVPDSSMVVHRITQRHAHLLSLFEKAGEGDKKQIELAASMACKPLQH